MSHDKKMQIRKSTAEFLVFTSQAGEKGIEVRVADETVGFRVNSVRATQFRQWAIGVLRDFAVRGYVLDKERLKNGAIFDQAYFDNLIAEIREIRASERRFYQKITDIYATAMDYSADAEATQTFFATVQNKLRRSS